MYQWILALLRLAVLGALHSHILIFQNSLHYYWHTGDTVSVYLFTLLPKSGAQAGNIRELDVTWRLIHSVRFPARDVW